jgi:3-deoxy-D-manno-octulosonic-acid transferase
MYLLYNLLLWAVLPCIVLYHCYRSVSRRRPPALGQRFGFGCTAAVSLLRGRRPIWVHAVSVGETIAVKPLIASLRRKFPDNPILVSNMTETGRQVATGIETIDCCIYFPFDFGFAARRLLRLFDPLAVIIAETEIWPNFIRTAKELQIPTIIVNGRISDRSAGRYLRLRRFFSTVLGDMSALCMQSAEDARRIIAIGAPEDRVHVTRNLKFDILVRVVEPAEIRLTRELFRLPVNNPIITAGSTHPGEEEQLLAVYRQLIGSGVDCVLVLVPRHPERTAEVAKLIAAAGCNCRLRSQLQQDSAVIAPGEVLLVDTIGELLNLYMAADIAFVGGSLVPLGGHNMLEPASLGRPVIFGKHISNFREIAALMLEYRAAIQVVDGSGLADALLSLLANRESMRQLGENGRRLLLDHGGATELNLALIEKIIGVQGERSR